MEMEFAVLAFVIVFAIMASVLLILFYRQSMGNRLSDVLAPRRTGIERSGTVSLEERFRMRQAVESLGAYARFFLKDDPKLEKGDYVLQQRMFLAGYRGESAVPVFKIAKVMVPVILSVLALVTGAYEWNWFIVFGITIGVGYLIPDYWLDSRIRAREHSISEGLPDLLDLLVVCLEAGLSMDQAAMRSSEEMTFSHPVIADEIGLVMLEVRAGQPRLTAWKHLADRTRVESVRMLVSVLVQADQFGTGISKILRTHGETMRIQARQRVEELAAKATVKLVFPLVVFLVPSLFIVLLGPAVITITAAFK